MVMLSWLLDIMTLILCTLDLQQHSSPIITASGNDETTVKSKEADTQSMTLNHKIEEDNSLVSYFESIQHKLESQSLGLKKLNEELLHSNRVMQVCREKNTRLEKQNRSLKNEVENHRIEANELQEWLQLFKISHELAKDKMERLEDVKCKFEDVLRVLRRTDLKKNTLLSHLNSNFEGHALRLKKQLESMKALLNETANQVEETKQQLTEKDFLLTQTKSSLEQLRVTSENTLQEKEGELRDISALHELRVQSLVQDKTMLESEMSLFKLKIQDKETVIASLEETSRSLTVKLDSKDKQLQELQESDQQLLSEKAALAMQVQKLENSLREEKTKTSVQQLQEVLKDLEQEKSLLQKEVHDLRQEECKNRMSIQEKELTIQFLEQKTASLSQESQELKASKKQSEETLVSLKSQVARNQQTIQDMTFQLEKSKTCLDEAVGSFSLEKSETETHISVLTLEKSRLESLIEEMKASLEEKETKLEALLQQEKRSLELLDKEVESKRQQVRQLIHDKVIMETQVRMQNKKHESDKTLLTNKTIELNEKLMDKEIQVQRLKKEVDLLTKKCQEALKAKKDVEKALKERAEQRLKTMQEEKKTPKTPVKTNQGKRVVDFSRESLTFIKTEKKKETKRQRSMSPEVEESPSQIYRRLLTSKGVSGRNSQDMSQRKTLQRFSVGLKEPTREESRVVKHVYRVNEDEDDWF